MIKKVNIGKDFSRYPAGRFPTDGKYNGETFRKKFIVDPLKNGNKLEIELDDAVDYGSSFLEEAFGGLIRAEGFDYEFLKNSITLIAKDEILKEEIWQYIEFARDE